MNCSLSRTARQRQRGNRSRSNTKSDCQENESFAQLLDAQSILGTLHHTRLKYIYHGWRLKGSAKEQVCVIHPSHPWHQHLRTLPYPSVKLFFCINWGYSAVWRFLQSHDGINSLEESVCVYTHHFFPAPLGKLQLWILAIHTHISLEITKFWHSILILTYFLARYTLLTCIHVRMGCVLAEFPWLIITNRLQVSPSQIRYKQLGPT